MTVALPLPIGIEPSPFTLPGVQPDEVPATPRPFPAFALAMAAEINRVRVLRDLQPVVLHLALVAAARMHAYNMAVRAFSGHICPLGRCPGFRIFFENAYDGVQAGEICALGAAAPADAVLWWLTSPGHRRVLLHPDWNEVGAGFTKEPDFPGVTLSPDAYLGELPEIESQTRGAIWCCTFGHGSA